MVTHQLQVECRTGKVRQPETDVLPLCHATNFHYAMWTDWSLLDPIYSVDPVNRMNRCAETSTETI